MGTDNLFHKRKAKKAKDLSRRKAQRQPYEKVLIVCEGSKTEPNYFNELRNHYELNSANIEISGDCGSSPINIWHYAQTRFNQEKHSGDPFDRVYCIFDKDTHSTYSETCQKIMAANPKSTFFAITSVPCFEYWLLLHFVYSTKPYKNLPGNSGATQLLQDLLAYFPEYHKGKHQVFNQLASSLEFAKQNAKRALTHANANHTDNPGTYVYELVEFLENLKN